jgi:hypothetical protein
MRALTNNIQSEDGVANAAIHEAAQRLEEQQERIQRLEEAGDFLSHYLREMPYASSYLAQIDERILRINNWREAKEAKL